MRPDVWYEEGVSHRTLAECVPKPRGRKGKPFSPILRTLRLGVSGPSRDQRHGTKGPWRECVEEP